MTGKINLHLAASNYFHLCVKKFSPPPPFPFTQAKAAKNITSPKALFDPCTHGKKFLTPSTKKVVTMCGEIAVLFLTLVLPLRCTVSALRKITEQAFLFT